MDATRKARLEKFRRERLAAEGKCSSCLAALEPGQRKLCAGCRDVDRINSRNRYRLRHGIPLDAPLSPQGRQREY